MEPCVELIVQTRVSRLDSRFSGTQWCLTSCCGTGHIAYTKTLTVSSLCCEHPLAMEEKCSSPLSGDSFPSDQVNTCMQVVQCVCFSCLLEVRIEVPPEVEVLWQNAGLIFLPFLRSLSALQNDLGMAKEKYIARLCMYAVVESWGWKSQCNEISQFVILSRRELLGILFCIPELFPFGLPSGSVLAELGM